MSFARRVKKEIAFQQLTDSNAKAQLASMIQASLKKPAEQADSLSVPFSQVFIAKRFVQLIKQLYQVDCKIDYETKHNLTKTSTTTITIREKVKIILEDLGLWKECEYQEQILLSRIVAQDDVRAYLAGWFLVKGSVNNPNTSNYHLEIRCHKRAIARFLQSLFEKFAIDGKVTRRRHEYLLYVKASDKISDVLRLIGAHQSLLEFEDVRIHRDFHNSLTRLDNCEVSNEMKSIKTGQKQVEAINKLIVYKRLDHMEQRIQDIAYLRLEYPEHSLRELSEEHYMKSGETISKSGIKHRLDKLMDAASRIND